MNAIELLLYIMTVIVMIASPGPVMILVASTGLSQGYGAAFRTILGTNIASLCLMALSIFMLKGLFAVNPLVFEGIRFFGCLYIGYLGIDIIKGFYQQRAGISDVVPSVTGGFKKGLLVGLSNPKDIIFFTAFFPQFIGVHTDLNVSLTILIITWIILDFVTLSLIYKLFTYLANSRIYPWVMMMCGVLFIGIALYGLMITVSGFYG